MLRTVPPIAGSAAWGDACRLVRERDRSTFQFKFRAEAAT